MSRFYEEAPIPEELRRDVDVYERIRALGIDLGSFEHNVKPLSGENIADVVFHESGLVYLSGVGLGEKPMTDDAERVAYGQEAARQAADVHIRWLHWALTCGGEGGDLNDVLYTVKGIGMVVSTDLEFRSSPAVVDGYSARWHSVLGGTMSQSAEDGVDPAGFAGLHARSAVGGFAGQFFSLEPEMIVAIPSALAKKIIANRGWLYPLPSAMYEKVTRIHNGEPRQP